MVNIPPKRRIALCLIWGFFALSTLYLNIVGRMPSGEWKFSVDPAGRLMPVEQFRIDNPVRSTMWVGHNLPVWLMTDTVPAQSLRRLSFTAMVVPNGHVDLVLETRLDEARTDLRLSTSTVLPSKILEFENGVAGNQRAILFDASNFSSLLPLGQGKFSKWLYNLAAIWNPRLLPKVRCTVEIDENHTVRAFANGKDLGSFTLSEAPDRFGFWGLGSDLPYYIDSVRAEYHQSPDDIPGTILATTFGHPLPWWGFLLLWPIFGAVFYLAGQGLGRVFSRFGQEEDGESKSPIAHFWPVVLMPFAIGLSIGLMAITAILRPTWKIIKTKSAKKHRTGKSLLDKRWPASSLFFITLILQGALFHFAEMTLGKTALWLLVAAVAWGLPVLVFWGVAKAKAALVMRVCSMAFVSAIVIAVERLLSDPGDSGTEVAVTIFAVLTAVCAVAVFVTREVKRPNIVLFIYALFFLFAIEGAFAISNLTDDDPKTLPANYQADSKLFWKLKSQVVPFGKSKEIAERRVVCLGGSVTWGVGIADQENAYPGVAQKILNREMPQYRWTVMNSGVPGYCSLQGRIYLDELMPYSPDFVSACFGVNEYNESGFHSTLVQYWEKTRGGIALPSLTARALRQSIIYKTLTAVLTVRDSGIIEGGYKEGLFAPNTTPDEFSRMLSEMDATCRKKGARLILMKEAHLVQLYGPHIVDEYQKGMAQSGKNLGDPVLDLTALLKSRKQDDMLLDSIHPTVLFHKMIGRMLAGQIMKMEQDASGEK